MHLNFQAAIQQLGGAQGLAQIANQARVPGDYVLETLLPERPQYSYHVDGGSMSVRGTMAGLVGMDSPYPTGGVMDVSTFIEQSAKIAIHIPLPEKTLRAIQQMVTVIRGQGGDGMQATVDELLNFYNALIIQPMMDTAEWLRGQALTTGAINWTFNKKNLTVDYGVPAANKLAARTGTAGYGSTASMFWADVRTLSSRVGGAQFFLAHPDTIELIRGNTVNGGAVVAEGGGQITFRRFARDGAGNYDPRAFSIDARDQIVLVAYGLDAEVLNPNDTATTLRVPFIERGKLVAVGQRNRRGYVVGQGALPDGDNATLGYTHVAPTIENGGVPGRWGQVFVPEHEPWSIHGRGAMNLLPVIEVPEAIAIATTAMV